MKHRTLLVVLAFLGFLVGNLAAKDVPPHFKDIQVERFTQSDGVGLSQNFIRYFSDSLREQLQKENIAGLVVDDRATVPAADAADSIVLEGNFTSFQNTSGFHAGRIGVEIKLYRLRDHQLITALTQELLFGFKSKNEADVPEYAGKISGKQFSKAAKDFPALDSFPPGPPVQTAAPSAAAPASLAPAPADVLTNSSVVEMVTAKLPEDVIIAKIQVSPTNFDVSTPALAELNQKGVSPAIVKAMLIAPKVAPALPQSPTSPGADHSGAPGQQHFSIAEGVSLPAWIDPQDFLKLFAGQLRAFLQKRNIPVQLAGDGPGSPGTDAAGFTVVECRISEVHMGNGSMANPVVITVESSLYRGSDRTLVKVVTSKVKAIGNAHPGGKLPLNDDNTLATWTADWVSGDIKKALK